jgi:glycosyltransferase involved in cell wall biosynthesis
MASMDLFVSYSAFESYGMALAEAAAMGLPILTTGVGEAERLVKGNNGLIIPLERPDVFAQAITQLLTDEPYRLGLGVGQK